MPKDSATSVFANLLPALSYAEFGDFGREAVAAIMNSNPAVSAGIEAIGREVTQSAEVAVQSAGETARGLLGARTLEDVVRLQTDYAQRSFAALVERSAKLTELSVALFGASTSAWAERAKS